MIYFHCWHDKSKWGCYRYSSIITGASAERIVVGGGGEHQSPRCIRPMRISLNTQAKYVKAKRTAFPCPMLVLLGNSTSASLYLQVLIHALHCVHRRLMRRRIEDDIVAVQEEHAHAARYSGGCDATKTSRRSHGAASCWCMSRPLHCRSEQATVLRRPQTRCRVPTFDRPATPHTPDVRGGNGSMAGDAHGAESTRLEHNVHTPAQD